jgi:hypothetical protein
MNLRKAKPQPVEAPKPESLADRINSVCDDAKAFIEAHVDKEKAANPSLPRDWIRLNTYAMNRASGCPCRCALALLEQENDGR